MNRQDIVKYCLSLGNTVCDYPFNADNNNCVARHTANKKWFALIYEREGRLCLNLKCEPLRADFLRSVYKGVVPAWHMNKVHWNTVYVDEVPRDEVFDMILHSFNLTKPDIKRIKYFTYVLRCSDDSLYCGYTDNVEKRLAVHNAGKGAKYTKARRPVCLVHSEGFFTKSAAMQRECEIKKMTRNEKLELIGENGK